MDRIKNNGKVKAGPVMRQTALEYRRRVCVAMNYISLHLDHTLSLKQIAEAACFSMFHFHRIFKAVAGETVCEFTRRIRIETAANRLIGNDEAVTGIALDCGFSSSQNFANAFKRRFGLTPSAYRRRNGVNKNSKNEHSPSLRACYAAVNRIAGLSKGGGRRKIETEVREMPELHVAYVRKVGAYTSEPCAEAFRALMRWAAPRGYSAAGKMMSDYWDNPEVTAPDQCRTDACVAVPAGTITESPVALQTIGGGPYFVCRCRVRADGFFAAWEAAFARLVADGYECADLPCYELYRNYPAAHSQNRWQIEICIPLRRGPAENRTTN